MVFISSIPDDLTFNLQNSDGTYREAMRLNQNGGLIIGDNLININNGISYFKDARVGIGEINPTRKLSVNASCSYDGIMLNNSDGKTLAKLAQGGSTSDSYFALFSGM